MALNSYSFRFFLLCCPLLAAGHSASANQSNAGTQMLRMGTTAPTQTASIFGLSADTGSSSTDFITFVASQTISGGITPSLDSGETVQMSLDNGATWNNVNAATAGTWTTNATLLVGSNTLQVRVIDSSGNTGRATSKSYVLDTTAPAAPAAPTLTAGSDTGTAGDGITSVTTPTVTGSTEAGATLKLYDTDGATVLGTATANGSGAWSITSSSLADGAHSLTVRATDAAGNTSPVSAARSVTIDSVAPVATLATLALSLDSGRSGTDFVTRFASQSITGTLGTALAAGDVVQISLDNGATWNTAAAAGNGLSWSYAATLIASNTLKVRVVDTAGNLGASTLTQAYVYDTSAPAKPGTPMLATASDTGESNSDGITSATQLSFSGTAEANAAVFLYDTDGTTVRGGTVADASGNWSLTSSTLTQGSHTLTVKAEDAAGNASVASNGLVVVVDTTAPGTAPSTPALDPGSDSGPSNSDRITNVTTPTFTGNGAEANTTVQVYDSGNNLLASGRSDGAGNWSATATTPLADATYSLKARYVDAAGNAGTFSGSRLVQIDTAAPNAPTLRLAAGSDTGTSSSDGITAAATPVFLGTTEANASVSLYEGTTVIGTATATAGGAWSITPAATLAEGSYTLTAKATDKAGNTGAASSVSITIDRSAPAAPSTLVLAAGSDTGASATDGITSVPRPTVTGIGVAGATITLYDSNGTTALGSTVAGAGGSWAITPGAGLSSGSHTLTAKASDAAGNLSAPSNGLSVTIDFTAPAAPAALTLAATSDTGTVGDDVTSVATPVIEGSAEALSAVTLYDTDGTTVLGFAYAGGSGNWAITSSRLANGTHTLAAKAIDVAGNTSQMSAAFTLKIESRVAAPSFISATPGDGEVTLSWSQPAGSGSEITGYLVTSSPQGSCTPSPALGTTCKVTGLTNGTVYTFTVAGVTAAGPGDASLPLSAIPVRTTATGSLPGGGSSASVTVSEGSVSCTLTSSSFNATAPSGMPAGATLPVGAFAFTTEGCPNDRLRISIEYPVGLPAGVRFMKFGPRVAGEPASWFELTATEVNLSSDRKTVAYYVKDNQAGDSNPALGRIDDPFAPVLLPLVAPGSTAAIPTLSDFGQILLSALLVLWTWRRSRTRHI